MIIKVCGITKLDQFTWLNASKVEMVGINFFPGSPRYVRESFYQVPIIPSCKKVGIFVNEDINTIESKIKEFDLDLIQLHGDEPVEYCERLSELSQIIKVFRVDSDFSFSVTEPYLTSSTYFLFDTNTPKFGGSGIKFDWKILSNYTYKTPFLLSGGIQIEDIEKIFNLDHPNLAGIDVNSGFEDKPGDKDLKKIEELLKIKKAYES